MLRLWLRNAMCFRLRLEFELRFKVNKIGMIRIDRLLRTEYWRYNIAE